MTSAPHHDGPSDPHDNTTPLLDALAEQPPDPIPLLSTLRLLSHDAAARAARLLAGQGTPRLETGPDIARFLTMHGTTHLDTAARHLGLTPPEVRHLIAAYEHGGEHGAIVYLTPCPASHEALQQARDALQRLRPSPHTALDQQDNRLTDVPARVQIRFGPDHRWYPYRNSFSAWQPAPGPDPDPATAYKSARAALRSRTLRP
ncbi:hypothetical protein ACFYXM_11525 [Streptomyces sp. NPDC002476]|uniref:hypothetical protein n=1 Tax=Streptomyces sp. NPDC002476 TaxID=3364648 RepID=UPI0036BDF3E7